MNYKFKLNYLDEIAYKKLERNLKKYNMNAFKKLFFDVYPSLEKGEFLGKLIQLNEEEQSETYDVELPIDKLFIRMYDKVKLNYTVYKNQNVVMLNTLEPKDILMKGELTT